MSRHGERAVVMLVTICHKVCVNDGFESASYI
jgi:hypothetical protein